MLCGRKTPWEHKKGHSMHIRWKVLKGIRRLAVDITRSLGDDRDILT